MGNRKATTNYIVTEMAKLLKDNNSHVFVKQKLESLSDKEFDELMTSIENESFYLPYYISNSYPHKIDLEKLVKQSRELGFDPFNNLVVEDPHTGQTYLTEVKYWVGMFPGRRQTQYLLSKTSIAKDNKSRDVFTGQVAGDSKGSSMSAPQFASLLGRGCMANALEFAKARGGDIQAGRALMTSLINNGGASMDSVLKLNSSPTVKKTMASYLNAAHIQHDL